MKIFAVVFLMIFVLLVGCSSVGTKSSQVDSAKVASDSCSVDSDCVCGGVDKSTGMCFMGNKEYYDKNVDKSKQCPDFCSGIAGNLVVTCLDNKCIQHFQCMSDDDCSGGKCVGNRCVKSVKSTPGVSSKCVADSDCVKMGCSAQLCRKAHSENVVTTCDYRREYDCLKMTECGCVDSECAWKDNAKYASCLKSLK